jgi:peptidylprolyl isomerase
MIKEGSKVKFHYKGTLKSGEVFDNSEGREPLQFEVGKGMIIPGLEKEMKGMKKGDKKKITVKAKDAYGEPKKELIREMPKGPVPEGMKLEKGAVVYLKTPDGQPFPAKIVDVKGETVKVDLNHPLAGQDLTFEVEIIEVK